MHGTYRTHIDGGAGLRTVELASSARRWLRWRMLLRASSALVLAAGLALIPSNPFIDHQEATLQLAMPVASAGRAVAGEIAASRDPSPPFFRAASRPAGTGHASPAPRAAMAPTMPSPHYPAGEPVPQGLALTPAVVEPVVAPPDDRGRASAPSAPATAPSTEHPAAAARVTTTETLPTPIDPETGPAPVLLAVAPTLSKPVLVVPPSPARGPGQAGETLANLLPFEPRSLASALPSVPTPPATPPVDTQPEASTLKPEPEPVVAVLAVAQALPAPAFVVPPPPPSLQLAAPGPRQVDIAQIAQGETRSLHVPQLHERGLVAGGGATLAAKVEAMQVRLPGPPRLTEDERVALLAEAPREITVRIGDDAIGKVAFRITETSSIDVQLSGLLDLVADRMAPAEFSRLRNSAAADSYIPLEELRAIGLSLRYDPVYDELDLSA